MSVVVNAANAASVVEDESVAGPDAVVMGVEKGVARDAAKRASMNALRRGPKDLCRWRATR
jgi:citrate lyase beta subunit